MSDESIEPVRVDIDIKSLSALQQHVRDRIDSLRDAGNEAALRPNTLGRAAEWAVLTWLRRSVPAGWAVEDVADVRGWGDVVVRTDRTSMSLEIKSTTQDLWRRYGRSVPRQQLDHAVVDAYIWCTLPSASTSPDYVHLMGWAPVDDVRRESEPQEYRSAEQRELWRPVPIYRVEGMAPLVYDIDDADDPYEWEQEAALGPYVEETGVRYERVSTDAVLEPKAKGPLGEGSAPRRYRHEHEHAHVLAPVRSMGDLIAWLGEQRPTDPFAP